MLMVMERMASVIAYLDRSPSGVCFGLEHSVPWCPRILRKTLFGKLRRREERELEEGRGGYECGCLGLEWAGGEERYRGFKMCAVGYVGREKDIVDGIGDVMD